jgi:DUF4097 and DUF4098 domain-containing protein YvlB
MRKLLLPVLLIMVAAAASATTLRENIDRTFDVRPGSTLWLDNVNGRITITSWDQPRIRVQAEKVVERTDAGDARKAMAELGVEMAPRDGGLSVKTTFPKRNSAGFWDFMFGNFTNANVRYEVSVPRNTNVEVSNTNGRVQLKGVTGVLRVETTNGGIDVEHCAGSADLSTTNGAIEAELTSLDPQKPVKVETTNGHIMLALPSGVRATIDAETTNGSVKTDLPVTMQSSGRHSLRGTINGGGASVHLRTTNGGIAIRGAQ